MGKLTQSIRDELTEYFQAQRTRDDLAAQSYEPRGHGYDPATDARLAALVLHRRVNAEWARIRRVVDELPAPVVEVLRLAVSSPRSVGCRLPSALERGRELAMAAARERDLDGEYRRQRVYLHASPITCAMRVLELDAALQRPHVTPAEVERVTALAVMHGDIDVDDEIEVLIDAAVDAYVAAREALKATKRADKARRRAESERALDELLGKKRRKEREKFERALRRAS